MNRRTLGRTLVVSGVMAAAAISAFAGPPLICWKVETGGAASLPWIDRPDTYQGMDDDYATSRLADDTLALLRAETPVLERMETLRRAALYASSDAKAGERLLSTLVERTRTNPADALAWFDVGYLVEASRQARGRNEPGFWTRLLESAGARPKSVPGLDGLAGYDCIVKALDLGGGDPAMEYAAALVTWYPRRPEHDAHVARAAAGATEGSLLEKNLLKNLGEHGRTLAELRAGTAAAAH
jgi:hypothetical protein